jgi:Pvc16 N-terminal domain/Carboxypeptidase regulatory-like domain
VAAVEVPLNTMLADLDETLKALLKNELGKHGFDGVEIAFDAPDKEWSAQLSKPTVNVFLYDVREAQELRPIDWHQERENGTTRETRPPLRVDASFAVTAWTRAVEDEHRLLSQVLAILYAYPVLAEDVLKGTLGNGTQDYPVRTRIAQERSSDRSDFWAAVGGQYKASLDYVVTVSCQSGTVLERGPEVRTQTLRLQDRDGGRSTVQELHRIGGVVRGVDGEPVENAWVAVEGHGWAVSDSAGRFRFDRLSAGSYRCHVRGPDGGEGEAAFEVPGARVDVALGKLRKAAKAPSSRRR